MHFLNNRALTTVGTVDMYTHTIFHLNHPPNKHTHAPLQMWIRKKENEAILGMLDKLDLINETPRAFDALIADRRYLAAVTRLDQAREAMFRCVGRGTMVVMGVVC